MQLLKRWTIPLLASIFVMVGIGLRLTNIGAEELWYDEIFGVHISYYTDSIAEIAAYSKESFFTPLYYIILRYWMFIFGISETATRMLSVLFSVATLVSIFYIGNRWFNSRVALTALFLATISPLFVEYGQEARPYAILCFLGLWSMYYFWQFINHASEHRYPIVITVINTIGIYLHFDFFILFATQGLIALSLYLYCRIFLNNQAGLLLRRTILYWLVTFVLFLPWVMYSVIPSLVGVAYTLTQNARPFFDIFLMGDYWFNVSEERALIHTLLGLISQLTVIGIIGYIVSDLIRAHKEKMLFSNEQKILAFLFVWYGFAAFFFFFSPLSAEYTLKWQRHIITFGLPLYFITAYGIQQIPGYVFKGVALFGVSGIMIVLLKPVLAIDASWSINHQNKAMVEYIEQNDEKGDLIFIPGRLAEMVVLYHYNGPAQVGGFLPLKGYNSITARKSHYLAPLEEVRYAYRLPADEENVGFSELGRIVEPYDRVWIFFGSARIEVLNWFIEHWEFVECPEEFCPRLYLFEKPKDELSGSWPIDDVVPE